MKSSTKPSFRKLFRKLPDEIQLASRKQFRLWLNDNFHPSLRFKKVGPYWCARVNDDYRALALEDNGDFTWFWIGPHAEYERLISRF